MNCRRCNMPMENTYICPHCGYEDKVMKKIIFSSNWHYNQGLSKAKVRDLSGAVTELSQALKYNKRNTKARNLLGLIYYQIGEIVPALSEWVISVHFEPVNNPAANYIETIKNDPQMLKDADRVIKQYNKSLEEIRSGNVDIAIMDLKKVVNKNPNFVKAYQLLALLYMEREQYSAAHKVIMRAVKIDRNNITSLNYLREINKKRGRAPVSTQARNFRIDDPNPIVIQGGEQENYEANNTGLSSYINVIIGIIIGAAAIALLVLPSVSRTLTDDYNQKLVTYSAQISERNDEIDSLNTEIDSLNQQLSSGSTDSGEDSAETDEDKAKEMLSSAVKSYLNGSLYEAGMTLSEIDPSLLTLTDDQDIYETIRSETASRVIDDIFNDGYNAYENEQYSEALDYLLKANRMSPDSTGVLYYLGCTYQQLGDYTKAKEYFTDIVENYSDSQYYVDANTKLAEIENMSSSSESNTESSQESTESQQDSTDSSESTGSGSE